MLEKKNDFLRAVDQGLTFEAEKLTVGEYLDQWLEATEGSVWYTTYRDYERIVRLHIKPEIGRLKLGKLTKMHVQGLVN